MQAYPNRLDQQVLPGLGNLRVRELSVGTIERHLRLVADKHGHGMAKMTTSVLSGVGLLPADRRDTEGAAALPFTGVDELLTPGRAGDYLHTGERFIRRRIAERRIDYIKLGGHIRVQRPVLDAYIEAGRVRRAAGPH